MAKLTIKEITKRVEELSNNTLICIFEKEYTGKTQVIKFKHTVCGNIFERSVAAVLHNKSTKCPICTPDSFSRRLENFVAKLRENGYEFISTVDNHTDRGTSNIRHRSCGCTFKRHNSGLLKGSVKCPVHEHKKHPSQLTLQEASSRLKKLKYGSFSISGEFKALSKPTELCCDKCLQSFKDTVYLMCARNGKCKVCFGSAKSIQEEYVAILLTDLGLDFERQYKLDKFYYDFKLTGYDILIEYDGEFHESGVWFSKPTNTMNNDVIKNNLASENDFKLYRIKHDDNVLKSILKIYEDVQRLEPSARTLK